MKRFILTLAILLLASSAGAVSVVIEGQTATAIRNLEFNGITYDVTFQFGAFEDLINSDDVSFGNFPFIDDYYTAVDARNAIIDLFNEINEFNTVGPDTLTTERYFNIPYGYFLTNDGTAHHVQAVRGWSGNGGCCRWFEQSVGTFDWNPQMYGIFAVVPVPIPAAVWLFGSALGLLGWMRRRA